MDKSLLIRFFKGEASDAEAGQVMSWLKDPQTEIELERQIKDYFDENDHRKIIWNPENICQSIETKIKESPAVITNQNESKSSYQNIDKNINDHQPLLRIASIILLVLIPAIGFFSYFFFRESPSIDTISLLVTKQAERGQKLSIYLSDGSKVILNSESEISYANEFDSETRKVLLKGEAYFEVTKDNSRPFIVQTDEYETIALGTSFNIRADLQNEKIAIALKTGKVMVQSSEKNTEEFSSVILIPGEMVTINTSNNEAKVSNFDKETIFDWTLNTLSFKNESLENVFARLEKWYAVEFTFNNKYELKKGTIYSGRFSNESLDNVLKGLGYINDFEYEIIDKRIEIKFN